MNKIAGMIDADKITFIRNKIRNICFYLGLLIEIGIVLWDKSTFINPYEGRLFRVTFLLFGTALLMTHYSKKEWLTIVLFGILGTVSYLVTGRNEILRIVVFLAACKDMNMKQVMKTLFWVTLAGCLVIATASLIGIFGEISVTQIYEAAGTPDTRFTLGFGHPNTLYCMVWVLMLLGMYVYPEKMKWYTYLCLAAGCLGMFFLTKTATGILIALFSLVLAAMFQYLPKMKESKVIQGLSLAGYAFCIIVSVLGAANANRVLNYNWGLDTSRKAQFYVYLDKILTGRLLTLASTEISDGTLQTWRIFAKPDTTYYFDLGWVRLFYWYGIIPAVIFILVLLYLLYFCFKKKDDMAVVMILSITIYTVVEAHFVSVYIARNYLLFLLGMYWYQMIPHRDSYSV
ncbi:MAG: hypothetical protein Q4E29_02390 [Lachnospiraceae bacterium]|nr:hypothetical protein [Lachnospiraceae bacterium]